MKYPVVLFDESMGIGKAEVIDPSRPSFWVSDFPLPRKTDVWTPFPKTLHFQPEQIVPIPKSSAPFSYPEVILRTVSPSFVNWEKTIEKFKKSGIEKVVLARKSSFLFKEAVNVVNLFHFLKEKSPNAFVFALFLSPNLAFIGATPENLFTRIGLKITTEALAGTSRSGDEERLLNSCKDMKEFLFVKETLTEQLQKICNPFSISQNIFIKKAGNVSHLHYPFSVKLKEALSDAHLINLLHPTPAIGGRPRDLALEFIHAFEPFDRGYYAGTVGFLSKEESRVYIGIRSALIDGNRMDIFTGAGIIPESSPSLEWQELSHKQGLFNIC